MKKVETTCDQCGRDLSDAGPMPAYMLTLTPSRMPSTSDIVYAVHVVPEITREHHFCGATCLAKWSVKWEPKARQTSSVAPHGAER